MKPVCLWPYPVSKLQETILKTKVKRLVRFGVIEEGNDSLWVAPSFAQPAAKKNRVIFLSHFRKFRQAIIM